MITAEIKDAIIDMLIDNADNDLFAELDFSNGNYSSFDWQLD